MVKILNNTTALPIEIADTGITIPALDAYSIPAQNFHDWAASSDVVVHVGSGDIVVGDGAASLSAADGMALLQGEYPTKLAIRGATDNTLIGNVGDRVKFIASDLPLPTGASTAALQTDGNASLSSIDGKLNSLGQKPMSGSVPVTFASDQLALPLSTANIATVFKQNEAAVTNRNENDLSGVTHTVAAGKDFALTNFIASYDTQGTIYIKLKKQVGGSGAFSTIFRVVLEVGGQGQSTIPATLANGVKVATAGDVLKVTTEGSISRGSVWACFAGVEY